MRIEFNGKEPEAIGIDRETGMIVTGDKIEIDNWKASTIYNSESSKRDILVEKYSPMRLNFWKQRFKNNFDSLDELEEKGIVTIKDYDEFLMITEFLYLHDNEYSVTKIDSDNDTATIVLKLI